MRYEIVQICISSNFFFCRGFTLLACQTNFHINAASKMVAIERGFDLPMWCDLVGHVCGQEKVDQ